MWSGNLFYVQRVLGKQNDDLADVTARRVAGGFLDDIAKIIWRHLGKCTSFGKEYKK